MATDIQPAGDAPQEEVSVRKRRPEQLSYDAKLAPSCMIWVMVVGLGFFIGVEAIWVINYIAQHAG